MGFCKMSGQTTLVSILPVATGSTAATQQQYYLDLLHYLCRNKKICINSSYPLTGNLNYTIVGSPVAIGNNTYSVTIAVTGTINYMPYVRNNGCCTPCAAQDPVNLFVTVPVYATSTPEVTLGATTATATVTPANVQDCCTITNACELEATLIVNSTTTPTAA